MSPSGSGLFRSPTAGIVYRSVDGQVFRAPDDWLPLPGLPPDAARLVADELGMVEDNEALGDALVEIGMAVGLPRPTAHHHWGKAAVLDRIAGLFADTLAAESQALGLYEETDDAAQ